MRKCLVTLAVLFSCINTSFALEGLGTEASPWLIQSLADFDEFASNFDYSEGHIRLDTDIYLTGRTYNTAVIAEEPIPSFFGTFDGNGHIIYDLTIKGNGSSGLFRCVDGSVTNLGLENANISGSDETGGICGSNGGSIANCYFTGTVTGSGDEFGCVGGLCGRNGYGGNITSCYSTGSVDGRDIVGGLCGINMGSINEMARITNCYSTSSVTGQDSVGGLCGENYSSIITDCYSSGTVNSTGHYVGGLCGVNKENSTITNCYATGSVTGGSGVGGLCGRNGEDYSDSNSNTISNCYATGSVTGYNYVGGLCGVNGDNCENYYYDSTIINCHATGSTTGHNNVGGLCGTNHRIIKNCYATGSVAGHNNVGGLCGTNSDCNWIGFCYATGSVIGSNDVGGLCGTNSTGVLVKCYSIGPVTGECGSEAIGGLCGRNYDYGGIGACYATGSVTGDDSWALGGLCGYNDYNGYIIYCYATGLVTTGVYPDYFGGLCGYNVSDSDFFLGCFWDTQSSGMADGVGNMDIDPSGVLGKTTNEMQDINTFLTANWDFASMWWINQGRDYPKLVFQPVGDLDNNSHVNLSDFAIMAAAWLTSDGDGDYNSVCELSGNNVVDIADLAVLTQQWLIGPQWITPGDFNSNHRVDLVDFAIFSAAWLTSLGQPGYNYDCDLVDDGTINIADLAVFTENWLKGI